MPTILALDTSTSACSVALLRNNEVLEDYVVATQGHTQRLLPAVDKLLAEAELTLADIDAIAFASGPGSFTGLRICLGTVQGLAYGADIPVIPVSTLQVMAASAVRSFALDDRTLVFPALDARMSEVYWGCYRVNCVGAEIDDRREPEMLLPDTVSATDLLNPDELLSEQLFATPAEAAKEKDNWVGVGDGWAVVASQSGDQSAPNTSQGNHQRYSEFYPHAYDLALLAQLYLARGMAVSVFDAKPAYIRNEVSWKKRERIRPQND